MVIRRFAALIALVITLSAVSLGARAQKKPELADVMKAVAAYLDQYAKAFTGLVADETYVQRKTLGGMAAGNRSLHSEVFILSPGDETWIGFRDLLDADGHVMNADKDRLVQVFKQLAPDSLAAAQQMSNNAGTANLNRSAQSMNIPTIALTFLTGAHQAQSTFKIDGMKTMDGVDVAILKFNEIKKPRLIHTLDEAAASGRFWVEVATGRIRQSELMLTSNSIDVKVDVIYGPQAGLEFWVPISMNETYQGPAGGQIAGGTEDGQGTSYAGPGTSSAAEAHAGLDTTASYSNYRLVPVDIKRIK